jgi:transcriptional regulator with XRE-family HTH domain
VHQTAIRKVGLAIRKLREQQGYSQEGFAQSAQIERARYGKIERGELNISLKVLFLIAAHLKAEPADLLKEVSLKDLRSGAED